jgi:hypothetical protein
MRPLETIGKETIWDRGLRMARPSGNAEVQMTRRNIKTIMAAFALGAPMMVSGLAQAKACDQNLLTPADHFFAYGVANVDCEWVMDERGNLYCMGILGEQERHVSPRR